MKTPSPKFAFTALLAAFGIAATVASPAFAQSYHERTSRSSDQRLYNYAPGPAVQQPNSDTPSYGNAPYDQRDDW